MRVDYHYRVIIILTSLFSSVSTESAGGNAGSVPAGDVRYMDNALGIAELIGERLILTTPFKYRLEIGYRTNDLGGIHYVDFGRAFGLGRPGVGYACTSINAPYDMTMDMQLEHNDGCKIWVDKQLVYEHNGDRPIELKHDERSVEMTCSFRLPLKKGKNKLLIKSETSGKEWCVYLQPVSGKDAVMKNQPVYPKIGLEDIEDIDSKIAELTNWLIIGPFENPHRGAQREGLSVVYLPERELRFGYVYDGASGPVAWTIPKMEVLGNLIDPLPWGTNYNWNYHNGGVAWAMQHLSEVSGKQRYADYAAAFCEFQLWSIPFVDYQVKTLNAFNSANHLLANTLLLDFTLAPSLPFIYRLRTVDEFSMRPQYERFIAKMNEYAKNGQVRLPGVNIYTRTTPKKYTTWVDDMFMGIPYLVQASLYAACSEEKEAFLEDAVSQIKGFNTQVWDSEAGLYMHARYHGENIKLPHWSRANGWGIWAVCEVLSVLPKNHPEYRPILKHFRTHVESLVKLQDGSGFWFNVLDVPDSRKEVSGTAMFTMAITRGIINGWLPAKKYRPVALKGWEAVKSSIEADGTVHDICYGTMCTEDVDYYRNRPFYDNDTHGLFAVLFAAMEIHKMMEYEK